MFGLRVNFSHGFIAEGCQKTGFLKLCPLSHKPSIRLHEQRKVSRAS